MKYKEFTKKSYGLEAKEVPPKPKTYSDIKEDVKDAWCVVTNMSLSAIDGILNMTPAFTHQRHVASLVTSRKIDKVEKPFKPGRKTVQEWLNMTANHQFTIQEIEDGVANNEGVTKATRSAIELAVLELIYQGHDRGFWEIKEVNENEENN